MTTSRGSLKEKEGPQTWGKRGPLLGGQGDATFDTGSSLQSPGWSPPARGLAPCSPGGLALPEDKTKPRERRAETWAAVGRQTQVCVQELDAAAAGGADRKLARDPGPQEIRTVPTALPPPFLPGSPQSSPFYGGVSCGGKRASEGLRGRKNPHLLCVCPQGAPCLAEGKGQDHQAPEID